MRSEGFYVNEESTDTSWDRTNDLPICKKKNCVVLSGVKCLVTDNDMDQVSKCYMNGEWLWLDRAGKSSQTLLLKPQYIHKLYLAHFIRLSVFVIALFLFVCLSMGQVLTQN